MNNIAIQNNILRMSGILSKVPLNLYQNSFGECYSIKRKSNKRNFLSAFSLIEVLVALLIASVGVLGAGKLLLVCTQDNDNAEHLQKAIMIAGAVVDSISMDPSGIGLSDVLQYWQSRLEAAFPGSVLSIERQILEEQWYYTIHIIFASQKKKVMVFKIAV